MKDDGEDHVCCGKENKNNQSRRTDVCQGILKKCVELRDERWEERQYTRTLRYQLREEFRTLQELDCTTPA